jgi:hypothetical protein
VAGWQERCGANHWPAGQEFGLLVLLVVLLVVVLVLLVRRVWSVLLAAPHATAMAAAVRRRDSTR